MSAMDMDEAGRPLSLRDRLAALGDINARLGMHQGRSTMQALCWWEECISPLLGCEVAPHQWTVVNGLPNSADVDSVLDAWAVDGQWSASERSAILEGDMTMCLPIFNRGRLAACEGVESRDWRHLAPKDYRPWYMTMQGFVEGIVHHPYDAPEGVERVSVSSIRQERDIRALLQGDPDFTMNGWQSAGGPGRVSAPPPAGCAPELEGFRGNNAGYVMNYYLKVARKVDDMTGRAGWKYAKSSYEAAWLYGRILLGRAADILPDLGDRVFLAHSRSLTCRETRDERGVVVARFELDGVEVAVADWTEDSFEVDQSWTDKEGALRPWIVKKENNLLVKIHVVPEYRGRGIGTYVMRHAITGGCRRVAPPFTDAEEHLWGLHGCPGLLGRRDYWTLEAVSWPTCATDRTNAPTPTIAA